MAAPRAEEVAATFDAAAVDFDRVAPQVWDPAGQALAFQAGLRPGDAVLDIGSGTGASALPAAAAVGPTGLVHAVDLSDEMLERGRVKASDRALLNVEFVCADATTWEPPSAVPDAGYDALLSSYAVFFLPEMDAAFARLAAWCGPAAPWVSRRGASPHCASSLPLSSRRSARSRPSSRRNALT